jgi:hypothetical protein
MSVDWAPVHVTMSVDEEKHTRIAVNGMDITRHCVGFKVRAGVGALADVWLDLIGVTIDVQAEVPPAHVREVTLERDVADQVARQTVDADRGRKVRQPHALLAVSLGQLPRQEGS